MVAAILKGLMAVLTKVFMSLATEALIEWLLFYVAHQTVLSTKTPHDDELYKKIKEAYDNGKQSTSKPN